MFGRHLPTHLIRPSGPFARTSLIIVTRACYYGPRVTDAKNEIETKRERKTDDVQVRRESRMPSGLVFSATFSTCSCGSCQVVWGRIMGIGVSSLWCQISSDYRHTSVTNHDLFYALFSTQKSRYTLRMWHPLSNRSFNTILFFSSFFSRSKDIHKLIKNNT